MDMDLFFHLYFNFLSVKTVINKNNNKRLNLINLEESEALKRQTAATWSAMQLNHFEMMSFKQYFKGFWSYILTFSILGFLTNLRDFQVFVFGYRFQNQNPEITENLYFWVYKVEMDMDLFFHLYFNFLSVKTVINKNNNKWLNLINLERSDALKRQKYDTWLAIWLNHFDIEVIWEAFREFLKLNSHMSVFWGFLMNFFDIPVFVFGYRSQNENPEIMENLYFLTTVLTVSVLKLT